MTYLSLTDLAVIVLSAWLIISRATHTTDTFAITMGIVATVLVLVGCLLGYQRRTP